MNRRGLENYRMRQMAVLAQRKLALELTKAAVQSDQVKLALE